MSLAIPSWAFGEVETAEPEIEQEKIYPQKGKITLSDGKERSLVRSEKRSALLPKESLPSTQKRESEKPLEKRAFKHAMKNAPARPQKCTKVAQHALTRTTPVRTQSLPKPLQLPTVHGKQTLPTPRKTTPLQSRSTQTHSSPARAQEGKAHREPARCEQGKNQTFSPLEQNPTFTEHLPIFDQEEREKKRTWTVEEGEEKITRVTAPPFSQLTQCSSPSRSIEAHYESRSPDKPRLERPKMGMFALYYILSKIGLLSDSQSHYESKQNIRLNEEETMKTHKARIAELKKAIQDEKSTKRWDAAVQVFSWFTTFLGIMTGAALILTGVGVVAGALLLTAGIITLTNQIMQLTGAWQKIAEKLPGDDPDKKRATIMWMQIGITVLCFILSGAGIVFGGFGAIKEAMSSTTAVMGGVIMMGYGTTNIGLGISQYQHRNRLAEIRKHMLRLAQLKHERENLQEKIGESATRIEQIFEELARALEFERELFRADQKVNRRAA